MNPDLCFFFSSRRRHTRYWRDWSSDVCSSDLVPARASRGGEADLGLEAAGRGGGESERAAVGLGDRVDDREAQAGAAAAGAVEALERLGQAGERRQGDRVAAVADDESRFVTAAVDRDVDVGAVADGVLDEVADEPL